MIRLKSFWSVQICSSEDNSDCWVINVKAAISGAIRTPGTEDGCIVSSPKSNIREHQSSISTEHLLLAVSHSQLGIRYSCLLAPLLTARAVLNIAGTDLQEFVLTLSRFLEHDRVRCHTGARQAAEIQHFGFVASDDPPVILDLAASDSSSLPETVGASERASRFRRWKSR